MCHWHSSCPCLADSLCVVFLKWKSLPPIELDARADLLFRPRSNSWFNEQQGRQEGRWSVSFVYSYIYLTLLLAMTILIDRLSSTVSLFFLMNVLCAFKIHVTFLLYKCVSNRKISRHIFAVEIFSLCFKLFSTYSILYFHNKINR